MLDALCQRRRAFALRTPRWNLPIAPATHHVQRELHGISAPDSAHEFILVARVQCETLIYPHRRDPSHRARLLWGAGEQL
jgi:hypothetical protein